MRKDLTELVFIIDRSGSMAGLEDDTIGGYNNMLHKQQEESGEAVVTTVLFDNRYEVLHDYSDINKIKNLTSNEYFVRGSTALLDAIGYTLQSVLKRQEECIDDFLPENTLFAIITDGNENSSTEYSLSEVKEMIEMVTKKKQWEFIFLGANIDAISTAESMGIKREHAADFFAESSSVRSSYNAVCDAVSDFRKEKNIKKGWKSKIK